MNSNQLQELLLQSLEHERGGVKLYQAALLCARNASLREEWTKYLAQTEHHVQMLTETCPHSASIPGCARPAATSCMRMGWRWCEPCRWRWRRVTRQRPSSLRASWWFSPKRKITPTGS